MAAVERLPPATLARRIRDEHPQFIAFTLANLPPREAAETLLALPEELQADVVARITDLGTVSPALFGELLHRLPSGAVARLLRFSRGAPVDYDRTQAFSDELDYAPGVWLNTQQTFRRGTVTQTRELILRIKNAATRLTHPQTAAPLIARIHETAGDETPHLYFEPAWPGDYCPSFLPSPGPGARFR